MQYTEPDYYQQFVCLAGECPATCCAGWEIELDEESLIKYIKYQNQGEPFGNRLFNGVNWKEGIFIQDAHKRCEFLNEENLCDIYSEAGKDMLCRTCQTYPRHIEEFEGAKEMSLAISCPEAARIILEKQDRVTFKIVEKERPLIAYEEFDQELFQTLKSGRDDLIQIIQERSVSLDQRMMKMLLYAEKFQAYIEEDDLKRAFEPELDRLQKMEQSSRSGYREIQAMWQLFRSEMEVLRETWPDYLEQSMEALYSHGEESYYLHKQEFQKIYPDWQIECEQLLVYWIYTYFTGAVYDQSALAKVKLAIVSTVFIRELDIARYIAKGGEFTKSDQIKLCMDYSREVEHSNENLERLERMLRQSKMFGMDRLSAVITDKASANCGREKV